MNETLNMTMSETEQAELDALLDLCLAEFEQARDDHERLMAQVDRNISDSKRLMALVWSRLEVPCGRN